MTGKDFAAPTPPLGWNSWDCYGPAVNEEQLLANAAYMAEHLKPHGYTYIVCDIQWYEPEAARYHWEYNNFAPLVMDAHGRLLPDPVRFPSAANGAGFGPIAEKIHGMGLKFGIHILRGVPRQAVHGDCTVLGTEIPCRAIAHPNSICLWNTDMYGVDAEKPGAAAYYESIFRLYASWGVDFVKVDDICCVKATPLDPYSAKGEIELIRRAIDQCGRRMVLSLSPGPADVQHAWHMAQNANMWRITDDFWDDWALLKDMFRRCELWQTHVRPGRYPDCDMLPVSRICIAADGKGRYTRFTRDEQITMLTLWCLFRSPLIIGGELRDCDDFTLRLLTNDALLRVNQHGGEPVQLFRDETRAAWLNFADGVPYAALFNLSDAPLEVKVDLSGAVGPNFTCAEELWTNTRVSVPSGHIRAFLPPHGAAAYRLYEKE